VRPEDGHGAVLQDAPEALADPSTGLWRDLDQELSVAELARTQRLEPDAVGGLLDRRGELRLDA
jgi:hypothetical protein